MDGNVYYTDETIMWENNSVVDLYKITLSTQKAVANGTTGLKWTTLFNKADVDKLKSNEKVVGGA